MRPLRRPILRARRPRLLDQAGPRVCAQCQPRNPRVTVERVTFTSRYNWDTPFTAGPRNTAAEMELKQRAHRAKREMMEEVWLRLTTGKPAMKDITPK